MTNTPRRRLVSVLRGDDGVSAILVCLVVAFLVIPVAAVSVDLSNAYSNRRQMQNAADAASQAGAQVMAAVEQGAQPASMLATVVSDIAAKNGSDTSGVHYSCTVASVTYDPLTIVTGPSCASWSGDATYNAVTVHTAHTVNTFFAGAIANLSSTSTSAGAAATATIQKVVDPDMGNSIFAMCAFDAAGNGNGGGGVDASWAPLLVDAGSGLELNTGQLAGAATPVVSAVGHRYVIWSNGGGNSNLSRCGLGSSSFDGLICGLAPDCSLPITLPNWLAINTGAQVGPTLATVAGYPTCQSSTFSNLNGPTTFQPCAMVMPVCDTSNSLTGSNGEIHCVAFGEFFVSPGDQDANDDSCTFVTGSSTTICARFVGPPELPNGRPDPTPPGAGDAYRVALVK
jgi:Flp pilus assembly protein TadG